MELFNGLLKVIDEKGLRNKYSSSPAGRLLAFWLDGWPVNRPVLPSDCLYDSATDIYIFPGSFGPDDYRALLGTVVYWIDAIRAQKISNYQIHITASVLDWTPEIVPNPFKDIEKLPAQYLDDFKVFHQFVAEFYSEEEASKVFLNIDGEYPDEGTTSICKLLISNI
ncbi:MAG: hypothetical protein A2089_03845 [Elusimicrobia bacterium GWD2_63_28]|nr:MAG: hypothetical protein A2089_03845 [Elusimicrobia bacterium GWD2_63_28]